MLDIKFDPEQAVSLLNPSQHERYLRRKPDHRQKSYLASRWALYRLCALYTGKNQTDIVVGYNRLQKPFIKLDISSRRKIEFNFSDIQKNEQHWGIFSFNLNSAIGVDVEFEHRKNNMENIAKRRFSANELDFVGTGATFNEAKCLQIWTRKEALGKAKGCGINYQMNETNLVRYDAETHQYEIPEVMQTNHFGSIWQLAQLNPMDSVTACIAYKADSAKQIKIFCNQDLQRIVDSD